MINKLFDWCVWLLQAGADALGITYQEINIYIFVVIWPIITVLLIIIILRQYFKIRRLKRMALK